MANRPTSGQQVLLIEDDRDIREAMETFLLEEGYRVQAATNGQEAIELLRDAPELPGLILLDWMMPVMDGQRFREIQASDPELAVIPTILITADAQGPKNAARTQVTGFLKKPVELKTLAEMIARLRRASDRSAP